MSNPLDQSAQKQVNPKYCTDKLVTSYAHVGLYDAFERHAWIARKRIGNNPIRVSHARLLLGGTQDTSTVSKDRFICYWFHPPNTGEGYVHGYPIEWDEGHLMVRLDPNWDFLTSTFLSPTDTARIEKNIDNQIKFATHLLSLYLESSPKYPLSLHLVGPRATDSMFYLKRHDPNAPDEDEL
ncbi:hypothetical protein JD969_06785 [Planctomycetota bacterium]|nr:hypothetical protein JD969_06785 [Planctomycetota bacterium]